MAGWSPWATSVMEGAALYSYWSRHLLWILICFLCTQCFSPNYQNTLFATVETPHRTVSGQGTNFRAKEMGSWAHDHGSHSSPYAPHHPASAGLTEQRDEISQTQLHASQVAISFRALAGSAEIYGAVSPTARIHRFKNQGVEMEVGSLNITLVNHEKIFASFYHDFMLCWSRGLSSKGKNDFTRRY